MTLSDLTTEQMAELARRADTTLGYVQQIRYGNRRPSPELARDLGRAAAELGIPLHWAELLYARPKPRRVATNRKGNPAGRQDREISACMTQR